MSVPVRLATRLAAVSLGVLLIAGCGGSGDKKSVADLLGQHPGGASVTSSGFPSSGSSPSTSASSAASSPASSASSAAPGRKLSVPAKFSTYRQLTGARADALAQQVSSSMAAAMPSSLGDAFKNPLVGIYGNGSSTSPSAIFIGFDTAGTIVSQAAALGGNDSLVAGAASGAGVTNAAKADAGPLGGAMSCGNLPAAQGGGAMCVWSDGSTFAMAMFLNEKSPTAAAKVVLQLRATAEH